MKILLIGTGRVAFNLGHAFLKAGVDVIGVVGRDLDRTMRLADQLGCSAFSFQDAFPSADIVLIAVSDDAIAAVSAQVPTSNAVVVHTSGATSIDLLADHVSRGVLWPVQTFISEKVIDLQEVPLIVEGNTNDPRSMILQLARKLSAVVIELDHARRQRLHLAAVFVSNFPAALVNEAEGLLEAQGLSKDLLVPLWRSTAANVFELGSQRALTGPAKRGDRRTIDVHKSILQEDPALQQIYESLTKRIIDRST
ncbi:MAG: DUF2520 domain-containing protein [Bacteroidota bacterium]|nr:DUF2520 domain-containing protein [Bacteroidota bacterium]